MMKSLIAAAAISLSAAALVSTPAKADVDFGIGVMIGTPGLTVIGGTPGWYDDDWHGGGISCSYGRQIVKGAGYHNVKTKECVGDSFTYTAKMSGDKYKVKVNRWSGNIISVTML